jgi:2'-5' RNA ligase
MSLLVSYVIIAPLEATRADLARIETLRRRHDPQAAIIPAHVTLVFPFETDDLPGITDHINEVIASHGPIALRLSAYLAVRAHDDSQSHIFLVPDQGRAEIEALHDALYEGPLASHLRGDIPFIPHVTIAVFDFHDEAEDFVRELGQVGMPGTLSIVDVIEFGASGIMLLHSTSLQK